MRSTILGALISLALVGSSSSLASAAPLAPPVECWIENQTPSVDAGSWAGYVVHTSGGYGTYAITFSFGDGTQQQGTYSSTEIPFSHVFSISGAYRQTATVTGAGSSDVCTTTTDVY